MTLREAMDQGIIAVTQEPWKSGNKYCRMELPVFPGKPHGIWGRIIDPCGNLALGHDSEQPIEILLLSGKLAAFNADPDSDEWEEWKEPADYSRLGKRWSWAALAPSVPEATK